MDLFMEVDDYNTVIREALNLIKDKAVNINSTLENEQKSSITVHECGHDEGKPCKNVVKVL